MPQAQKKRARLGKLIVAGAAALIIVVLALLEYFLPIDLLLPALAIPPGEEGTVRLHFVDVGQGDCTVVEFPEGELLVVDGGNGGFASRTHLIRYIKGLHPSSVSLLATHSDSDHIGGLVYLLRTFDIERCYLPLCPSGSEEYSALLEEVEREGCPTEVLTRYSVIARESGYLVCLSPRSEETLTSDDVSTVLYVQAGGVRALLCGDISSQREELLLREYAIPLGEGNIFEQAGYPVRLEQIELLKAAHHGSASSSSAAWLGLLRPQFLLISCGRGNSYRHPSQEALARFRAASPEGRIFRTDELGDIIFSMKDGSVPVAIGGGI